MVGVAFTGTGSFVAPGLETWQATVKTTGTGSGRQPLALNSDKTFDLNHVYLKTGSFTATVSVVDSNGGTGSASFPVKVKDYLFTIQAEPDASINEGDTLKLEVPVQARPISWGASLSITVTGRAGRRLPVHRTGRAAYFRWITGRPGNPDQRYSSIKCFSHHRLYPVAAYLSSFWNLYGADEDC